uniref:PH domain-containing protein n=1 Tax=Macrostomum lignano TaxID=282301 RepID=A0A1I8IB37_9PLAT
LDTIRGRYESALTACKSAAPQRDIQSFVRSRLAAAAAATAASSTAASGSAGPSDRSAAPFELATYSPASLGESDFVLKDEIVNDRLTEAQLRTRHQELAKESQELKSFIRQNEEVTESLKIFCQRNLGNHLYDKVYETQEDLSRKRNEIRMASIQLAAVQAQRGGWKPDRRSLLCRPHRTPTRPTRHRAGRGVRAIKSAWRGFRTRRKNNTARARRLQGEEQNFLKMSTAAEESATPPPPSSSRWLSRHGSLRQAAGQLSRRLAARLSLTRQRSLGGASSGRSGLPDPDDDDDEDGDPYAAAAAPGSRRPTARFSLPKATSSYDGFVQRGGRMLSARHQRSCDSHDESVASAASAAGSSRGSSADFCATAPGWTASAVATKSLRHAGRPCRRFQMDMMNFGKKSDEADADDKKDDASMKGLWKRAFNTLRIRDKEKPPKKKKGGKDEDDAADDVDPVYSLLKRAADKGVQKCTGCTPESGGSPLSAGSLQPGGKSGGDLLQAAGESPDSAGRGGKQT